MKSWIFVGALGGLALVYGLMSLPNRYLQPQAPEFRLTSLGHGEITGEALKGKHVLVNFWATWCSACKEETPYLEKLSKALAGKASWRMLGVASYDEAPRVAASEKVKTLSYEMALDEDGAVAGAFGIHALPQTLILDPEGRVVYRVKGRLTDQNIEEIKKFVF